MSQLILEPDATRRLTVAEALDHQWPEQLQHERWLVEGENDRTHSSKYNKTKSSIMGSQRGSHIVSYRYIAPRLWLGLWPLWLCLWL